MIHRPTAPIIKIETVPIITRRRGLRSIPIGVPDEAVIGERREDNLLRGSAYRIQRPINMNGLIVVELHHHPRRNGQGSPCQDAEIIDHIGNTGDIPGDARICRDGNAIKVNPIVGVAGKRVVLEIGNGIPAMDVHRPHVVGDGVVGQLGMGLVIQAYPINTGVGNLTVGDGGRGIAPTDDVGIIPIAPILDHTPIQRPTTPIVKLDTVPPVRGQISAGGEGDLCSSRPNGVEGPIHSYVLVIVKLDYHTRLNGQGLSCGNVDRSGYHVRAVRQRPRVGLIPADFGCRSGYPGRHRQHQAHSQQNCYHTCSHRTYLLICRNSSELNYG